MDKKTINKYIAGDASQEEKEAVQLWIEADVKNRKEFMTLRVLYDITLGNLPEKENKKKRRKNSLRLLTEIVKIAAVILITFGCTYYVLDKELFVHKEDTSTLQTLHVPAGQRAELTLSDGTKVWLNSLTTFSFPSVFSKNKREVFLDGEGYFDVSHHDNSNFTVKTESYAVNVLGTEFNILAYSKSQRFEASLINGSVEITSNNGKENVLLVPNQHAYLENNKLITSSISHFEHFLWKEGIISLHHESMGEILNKLEVYYDTKIINKNKRILSIHYTGKFRVKDGVEHVLRALQVVAKFQFSRDNEKNIIYIN